MVPGLEGFSGPIERAAGMARVNARSGLVLVVVLPIRFAQVGNGIPDRDPRLFRR